jgi:hypothetical protein
MTTQNSDRIVTAQPPKNPVPDFWGRVWYRIFEGRQYKTRIKARSAQNALNTYSQQKYLSK